MPRVYIVTNKVDGVTRLVRANSQAQAIRHVAGDTFDVGVPTQDGLVHMLTVGGVTVENSVAEAETES